MKPGDVYRVPSVPTGWFVPLHLCGDEYSIANVAGQNVLLLEEVHSILHDQTRWRVLLANGQIGLVDSSP